MTDSKTPGGKGQLKVTFWELGWSHTLACAVLAITFGTIDQHGKGIWSTLLWVVTLFAVSQIVSFSIYKMCGRPSITLNSSGLRTRGVHRPWSQFLGFGKPGIRIHVKSPQKTAETLIFRNSNCTSEEVQQLLIQYLPEIGSDVD
ncbi:MAG: hypothetical protein ABL962_03965 [Fimbriimonadaceae bacterium]